MKNLLTWARDNVLSLTQTVMLFVSTAVLFILLNTQIDAAKVHQVNDQLILDNQALDRDTNQLMIKMIEQRGQLQQQAEVLEEWREIIGNLLNRINELEAEKNRPTRSES